MLRQFFNTSIEQSFLKALMSAVQFPKFSFVNQNDLVFSGYFYIYKSKIIYCTKTGYIDAQQLSVEDYTLGEETEINYSEKAEYDVIKHYNPFTEDQNIEFKEFIRASYYSTELHKRLGDYLRLLRDFYHIDLMGMYNCFSYEMVEDLYIGSNVVETEQGEKELQLGIKFSQNKDKKVLAVPVKFNREYTVFITSNTPVYYSFMVKFPNGMKKLYSKSVVPELKGTEIAEPHSLGITDFYNPPKPISTALDESQGEVYKYNDKLYLLIQVDRINNSSFVVLEGNYQNTKCLPIVSSERSLFRDTLPLIYKPSLIKFNDGYQYAYSNNIIPHLVRNVIDNNDITPNNISYVKSLLGMQDDINYWRNDIKYLAYDKYMFDKFSFDKDSDGYNIQPEKINYDNNDITGYIDSTIEGWLNAKQ